MRTLFVLTLVTLVALTAYFYGPQSEADSPMGGTDWLPQINTDDQDAVAAGLEHLKQEAPAPQQIKPDAAAKPAVPAPKLRRKTGAVNQQQTLPRAPEWQPDKSKKETISEIRENQRAEVPAEDRNFSDPMQNRWVEGLSGRKLDVSFSKSRTRDGCGDFSRCDEIRNSRDARVVGVIVKTNKLWKTPTKAIDGQWTQGHYERGTPAVYVK